MPLRRSSSRPVTIATGRRTYDQLQLSSRGPVDVRLRIFRSLLEPLRPGQLVDLGCGHGKFSLIASQLGWDVTAVDARTERMPNTDGIRWVQADVRDYSFEGYDCVCILGLLYHLELGDQLDLLARSARTSSLTIIDTHVALHREVTEGAYEGRYFEERLEASTASWGNRRSFWPTEDALLRMLKDCGYNFVFKLAPPYLPDRTFYLAR